MFAVGVDVSNGRSTVAVLRSKTEIIIKPFDVLHTVDGLKALKDKLSALKGDVRIVMEHTGRYYESIAQYLHNAGFFVCALNPLLIKRYGADSLRKIKTDKADAVKIAKYALDNWHKLRQYDCMDETRYTLKTLHRQYQMHTKTKVALTNNLIALLEQNFPGVNKLFTSPTRSDGSQKWVDFVNEFWHIDCVSKLSLEAFTKKYQKWCENHEYIFSAEKAAQIHAYACQHIALTKKSSVAKMMVKEAVTQLQTISRTVEVYRAEMNRLASQLPEYDAVISLFGVGTSIGPQLMAEIGDPCSFARGASLVAFAGNDPGKNASGDAYTKSNPISKRGSPYLRKTLFVLMKILLQSKNVDDPVYQFLMKKKSEGKPYHVYMTAGMTKFLRIYYGRVRDSLKEKGLWTQPGTHDKTTGQL